MARKAAGIPETGKGRSEPALHAKTGARGKMCDPAVMASSHVLDWLAVTHDRQDRLCRLLEEIADALPGPVNQQLASSTVPALRTLVTRHIAIQKHILFPMLRRRVRDGGMLDPLIDRIALDNASDELLAHDVADLLEAAISEGQPEKPGMLAYMLRGLFEGRRRHIAWERISLLPLARESLTPEDLTPLTEGEVHELLASGKRPESGNATRA